MDESGSRSCRVTGFDVSGVEPSGSTTRDFVVFHSVSGAFKCRHGAYTDERGPQNLDRFWSHLTLGTVKVTGTAVCACSMQRLVP
jgi:hypothetical protein